MKTYRLLLLCVGLACSATAHATNWLATQIVSQEGWSAGQVYGLNNLGQVIGTIDPPPPPPFGIFETVPMGFVTGPNGKGMQAIDPNYSPYIEYCHGCHTTYTPRAINDAGQVVASTFSSFSMDSTLQLTNPGGWITLPTPPSSLGIGSVALNNSGQVAGTFIHWAPASFVTDANGSNPHAPAMLDNSYDSYITGINDHGQLLVAGVLAGTSEFKHFVSGPNATGVAFEVGSGTRGLNNTAQLFGNYVNSNGDQASFVTGANGVGFTDIGSLGGPTFANAINNNGLVVGYSDGKAYVYGYQGGGIVDLNQLVKLRTGEFLSEAADINDRGQIVAMSNLGHMYLLSPVPEPATYLMLLCGLAYLIYKTRGQPTSSISFT
ncbi:MAG TPA: hypothetical protein VL381_10425 [Rhodocyclaceae bacterium]|nr:hypothetical protein [Rhodocyclaceae bacterium]